VGEERMKYKATVYGLRVTDAAGGQPARCSPGWDPPCYPISLH